MLNDSSLGGLIINILAAFGGGATVSLMLFSFLGKLIAERIAREHTSDITTRLEDLKAELALVNKSYENQLEHVVTYYSCYYEHYRRCQELVNFSTLSHPEKDDICTKVKYELELDNFVSSWSIKEPRIRLILPQKALDIHLASIVKFNEFTNQVKKLNYNTSENKVGLSEKLKEIQKLKDELEVELRKYLRTDLLT